MRRQQVEQKSSAWVEPKIRRGCFITSLPLNLSTALLLIVGVINVPAAQAEGLKVSSLSAVRAYPNPWRSDKHPNVSVKFDGMPAASTVKLFTVSGHEVKTLTADARGTASWDRTNDSGDLVASGVYIYLIIDPQGNDTSGKLAIIK